MGGRGLSRGYRIAMNLSRSERWTLTAMGVIAIITVGWWTLALWPSPGTSPEWLLRAKNVCFGNTETGLPNSGGWVLLIGQPLGMFGVLIVAWWADVQGALAKLLQSNRGRAALIVVALMSASALAAAGVRVAGALRPTNLALEDLALPVTYPRLDREAPELVLTDHAGEAVDLRAFVGRPVLVTFGFGHCETVCPLVIHNARAVQDELGTTARPVVLVVTLDPWRDTPTRLVHLKEQWGLEEDAFVLGGTVTEVNQTLDAWNVARERDLVSGDLVHAALTFIIDPSGKLAYATSGDRSTILDLLDRL